jgi:hypothetical protein
MAGLLGRYLVSIHPTVRQCMTIPSAGLGKLQPYPWVGLMGLWRSTKEPGFRPMIGPSTYRMRVPQRHDLQAAVVTGLYGVNCPILVRVFHMGPYVGSWETGSVSTAPKRCVTVLQKQKVGSNECHWSWLHPTAHFLCILQRHRRRGLSVTWVCNAV